MSQPPASFESEHGETNRADRFFYAHKLTDSNIKGLNVKNTPVQGFSINGAKNLGL